MSTACGDPSSTGDDGVVECVGGAFCAGDFVCVAGLSGTYMAWLARWNPEISPVTRFTYSANPYVLVDGTKIADDWDDLIDGTLDNPIALDEWGDQPPPSSTRLCSLDNTDVFTGTSPNGNGGASHCNGWTSNGGDNGMVGSWAKTSNWDWGCDAPICTGLAPIYCFEQ